MKIWTDNAERLTVYLFVWKDRIRSNASLRGQQFQQTVSDFFKIFCIFQKKMDAVLCDQGEAQGKHNFKKDETPKGLYSNLEMKRYLCYTFM